MPALLEIEHLSVSLDTPKGKVQAARDVSLTLRAGETLALVGESGCGKSMLCKAVLRLLPGNAAVDGGRILVDGREITKLSEREMVKLRGSLASMLFQEPMTSLNPSLTVGAQISEAVRIHHRELSKKEAQQRAVELMELVGIDQARERCELYPGHFSGGMRQRAVLAMALAGEPRLLLADEPTTALDVTIQAQILDLLGELQKSLGMGMLLVSHDLGVVAQAADRAAIMYAGKIVEIGTAEEIFSDPRHPYTQGLLRSLPAHARGQGRLYAIPGMPPSLIEPPKGDAFACRNELALAIDYEEQPPMFSVTETHSAATWLLDARAPSLPHPAETPAKSTAPPPVGEPILEVQGLSHRFRLAKKSILRAVDGVSFQVRRGEIFGLIGESGSGKSTIVRCVMGILRPSEGRILYEGMDAQEAKSRSQQARLQRERQLIFQDATASLNQRMRVEDIITEPLRIHKTTPPRGSLQAEAAFRLQEAGLDESYLNRYPPELSGGQRQRVAIARALVMEPRLLVADEPIASLDVSIQAQTVNLFRKLREDHGCAILFIAHDLAMVEFLCDRVGVLYQGRLVEQGPASALFARPLHPYTQALLSASPLPDPAKERARPRFDFNSLSFEAAGKLIQEEPGHFVLRKERRA